VSAAGRLPVWERLRAPDSRPLVVRPLRRAQLDTLRVVDGDLPDVGGATLFDAWADADAYHVRAASIDDVVVTPYQVLARDLAIEASDGRLEALLGEDSVVSAHGELERQACACRGISVDAVYRAVGAGWRTADQVKRATRLSFGVCQGRRCVPWLADRLELDSADPRAQVSPRPPLVPVPASVLAAFAGGDD
jgi:bacterioferritin-associated ferredoxin